MKFIKNQFQKTPNDENVSEKTSKESEIETASEKSLERFAQREKLKDPKYLPTREEIIKSFVSDNNYKQWVASGKQFIPEEDIEGGLINCDWIEFCSGGGNEVFEFLNEEYMNSFADYITLEMKKYNANKEKPLVILEICAGNGRLSHFLQQKLEERVPEEMKVIATDSGKRGIINNFPVEQIDYKEALKKYKPDIVVCSWMPYDKDFSYEIRECKSVQEYILIGDIECCGESDKTWGQCEVNGEKFENSFKMEKRFDLSNLQMNRAKDPRAVISNDQFNCHASTYSFKKNNKMKN